MGTLTAHEAARLYETHACAVSAYIRRRVADTQDAEDLLSLVFERAIRGWDTYDESQGAVAPWLYGVARNAVTDYYRGLGGRCEIPVEDLDALADRWTPEDVLLNAEGLSQLASALERLPERERDLLLLRFYENLPPRRVGELMGLSYVNVRVIQARALSKLKDWLTK